MKTIFLSLDDQLGENDSMVGINSQISNPPFDSTGGGSVNNELLILNIICSSGLQILDVWAVTKLCLSITPKDLPTDSLLEE